MRLEDAKYIIELHKKREERKEKEYRVSFEKIEGALLVSGYFPERDEMPFETEQEAWDWALDFAHATRNEYINIYVVDGNYSPVPNYELRMITNR